MTEFDAATAVRPAERDGCYHAFLDADWQTGDRANGGYLLALLGRAASQTAQAQSGRGAPLNYPVAASAHYVAPSAFGTAEVEITVLHVGKQATTTRATLRQQGTVRVEALITCGTLAGDVWWDAVPAPEMPPQDACVRLSMDGPGTSVPLMGVLVERLDPATMGWVTGRPSGRGELRGWVALADGRPPDPLSLLTIVDCLPPATFDLGVLGWAATMELTCHVRAVPQPGPLLVRQRIRHVASGRVDEICDVWDSRGRLVATGQQLAAIRVPVARQTEDSTLAGGLRR
jgi:acyl-coenzyme A thioesterase PaaI-like protein